MPPFRLILDLGEDNRRPDWIKDLGPVELGIRKRYTSANDIGQILPCSSFSQDPLCDLVSSTRYSDNLDPRNAPESRSAP